jgi:hypothetical protein
VLQTSISRNLLQPLSTILKQTATSTAKNVSRAGQTALANRILNRNNEPDSVDPKTVSERAGDDNPVVGESPHDYQLNDPSINTKGYPAALGSNDVHPSHSTQNKTLDEPGEPGTMAKLHTTPSNAANMEYQQTIADDHTERHTVAFEENPRGTNSRPDSTVAVNYDVESLKSWLNREHRLGSISAHSQVHINTNLIKTCARGRLNHFTWFRGDPTLILRWNAPKNVFGAFLVTFTFGSVSPDSFEIPESQNFAMFKQLVDIQDNVAELRAPFLFPRAYLNLFDNASIGVFTIWMPAIIRPRSVSETTWNIHIETAVRFDNISLLTPSAYSSEGIIASKLAIGATVGVMNRGRGQSPNYEACGQDVIRTFSEGINLCRADGMDPAMPMNREVCKISSMCHPLGFSSFKELAQIPFYRFIGTIGGLTPVKVSDFFHESQDQSHASVLRDAVAYMRCDFRVTLNCFCTGFHSGRVRIVYHPTWVRDAPPADDLMAIGWAPSILWNIEENKTITFDLPYGAAAEYNEFPVFWLIPEIAFTNTFGTVAPPIIVATLTPANIATIGYGHKHPMWTGGMAIDSNQAMSVPALEDEPQAGFDVPGWYNQNHTSENEYNYCLRTLFRRPARGSTFCRGVTRVNAEGLYYRTRGLVGRFIGFGGRVMNNFVGWRGTLKVSISTVEENKFTLDMHYLGMNSESAGTIISSEGFIEVSIPYCTPNLFYTTNTVAILDTRPGPALTITPKDSTLDYTIFVSMLDDFELIGPTFPRRVFDFVTDP